MEGCDRQDHPTHPQSSGLKLKLILITSTHTHTHTPSTLHFTVSSTQQNPEREKHTPSLLHPLISYLFTLPPSPTLLPLSPSLLCIHIALSPISPSLSLFYLSALRLTASDLFFPFALFVSILFVTQLYNPLQTP